MEADTACPLCLHQKVCEVRVNERCVNFERNEASDVPFLCIGCLEYPDRRDNGARCFKCRDFLSKDMLRVEDDGK